MQREHLVNGTAVMITDTHRFGQDALLLAQFCRVRRAETVCDLGTGCGIIPLRWHDRGHRGECLAVDISPQAIGQLEAALRENQIGHITACTGDLRERKLFLQREQSCDVVCCNPPYFTGGFISPNERRAAARHELSCTVSDVCRAAYLLLKDGGRLCMCHRPERLADVLYAMRTARIEPKRLQFIASRPEKEPWLFLIEGQKNRAPGMRVLPQLITADENGRPSAAMLEIYGQEPKEDAP